MNLSILKCKRGKWISKYDFGTLKNHCVKTRYYDSQFLYQPNADNLYQCINTGTSQLSKQQMIQLSMNGPNANWKVFEKFNTAREANDDPCLADIGSFRVTQCWCY